MMDPSPTQHRLPPPTALFPDGRMRSADPAWVAAPSAPLRRPSSQYDRQLPNLPQILPRGLPTYEGQPSLSTRPSSLAIPSRDHDDYSALSAAPPAPSYPNSEWSDRGYGAPSRYAAHTNPTHWTHHSTPPHLAQHLPPPPGSHWPLPVPPPAFQQHNESSDYSRKKRLRNSRSCAECQRRKTRCDAVGTFTGDAADGKDYTEASPSDRAEGDMIVVQPCTNCSRSGVTCQYSKKPSKRGPSKGYIKDLESRLIDLENQTLQSADRHEIAEADDSEWMPEGGRPESESHQSLPDEGLASGKRPTRPWEFKESYPIKKERTAPEQQSRSSIERDSVDAAQVMVSLSNSPPVNVNASVSSDKHLNDEGPPKCAVEAAKAATPQAEVSEGRTAVESTRLPNGPKVRHAFAHCEINGTFGIRPLVGDEALFTNGMDDRLVVRAMQLLLDAASPPSALLTSEAISRMTTPASVTGTETIRLVTPGRARQSNSTKTHSAQLAHLQGLCMAGARFNGAEGFLSSSNSAVSAIAAARKVRNALSCLEGEALLLCYLDGLRHGNPDNSALAAACSKVSMCHGQDADAGTTRRNCALFAVDRWHAAFFNTSHALTGRALPADGTLYRQMEEYTEGVDGCLRGTPAEVIRAALMFNSLQSIAESHGGYKNVSRSQCESILHSAGSLDDDVDSPSEGCQSSDALDTLEIASVENGDEDEELQGNLYTVAALKTTLRGTFKLFFHLQTLPLSADVTPTSLRTTLTIIEECILVGRSRTPMNPKTLLMRSFVGPFVFAIASTAISWLARAITVVAKRSHETLASQEAKRESIHEELPQIAYLGSKLHDYARMLGQLSICTASTGQQVQPLWLRVAAYNHTNVSYLSLLTDILVPPGSSSEAEAESKPQSSAPNPSSPLRDSISSLCKEADGRAALIQEMGPLGLVLASTTAKEAWSLITEEQH